MLRVGLTGGIGSGKSTVAQRFLELGAVVVDADLLAREVVAVGSPGLAAIHQRFGDAVLAADGSLDRAALGEIVFSDPRARRDLEAITHPLIGARTRAILESAAPERILVHDVPLLVEKDMTADYHLTVVVGADEDIRVARLTGERGFTAADVRGRIAAQASDRARRAAADAWLDNNGTQEALLAQVDALWQDRIVVFNDNLMSGSHSRRPDTPTLVPYDESWPLTASRLIGRIKSALGDGAVAVEHIGSTSVPGLTAKDVIDLQIGVRRLSDADAPEFVKALADKGFPRSGGDENNSDDALPWIDDVTLWQKRFHGSADPGRIVHLHVREIDGPGWRYALLFRDWLRAEADERTAYAELKARLARTATTTTEYVEAKGPWIVGAMARADTWARHTSWSAL
ncbi:MAG TPA: dephospho-CoA kinase [Dermatophilaceae bacterium]|jgi:dephospho-CoA kinase